MVRISRENITFSGGLGPIQALADDPLSLEIKPLTVFIGPQGTGKSLVSQFLYFFHDAKYLLSQYSDQQGPESAVRNVLESIRAGEANAKALASFITTSKVHIDYFRKYRGNARKQIRKIALYQSNRRIEPLSPFKNKVSEWFQTWLEKPAAADMRSSTLFVPAERTFFSHFINSNPKFLAHHALPLGTREFASMLIRSADVQQNWYDRFDPVPPKEAREIENIVSEALAMKTAYARKGTYARNWLFTPLGSDKSLQIELASSGQMSAWPFVFVAQALFGLPENERPRFIHIEEPENHLHPDAQIALVKLLAYLANKGFRLVITTHSLFVLFVLNNLAMAYDKLGEAEFDNLPKNTLRLKPEDTAAYLFADNTIRNIMDESGQIDDSLLERVLGELDVEQNKLMTYKVLWGE